MTINGVEFPEDRLADFCRRHGVASLSVFGSILTDSFGPSSDVDVLVVFQPGRTPGLFGFGAMVQELQELTGRRVDLRTPEDLSKYFRARVMREARPLHAA